MIGLLAAFSWLDYLQHFHDCPICSIFIIGLLAAFSWLDYLQHVHDWNTCKMFMIGLLAAFSWWTICSIFLFELLAAFSCWTKCSIFIIGQLVASLWKDYMQHPHGLVTCSILIIELQCSNTFMQNLNDLDQGSPFVLKYNVLQWSNLTIEYI